MNQIKRADLPVNRRGAIYHLNVRADELADNVILVGDPERVNHISWHLDSIAYKSCHREFNCHTGYLGTKSFSILSTGIGSSNIDIVLNELNALATVDLQQLTPLPNPRKLKIIRLGTTGALQADISIGDVICSEYGIGFDNLFEFYPHLDGGCADLLEKINTHLNHQPEVYYVAKASTSLNKLFESVAQFGITATCPGFYAPQQRQGMLNPRYPHFLDTLRSFRYNNKQVLNFEMETAAIFKFGQLMNHQCCSLSVVLANRYCGSFSSSPEKQVHSLIEHALDKLAEV